MTGFARGSSHIALVSRQPFYVQPASIMSTIKARSQRLALVALAAFLTFLPASVPGQNGIPATLQAVTPIAQQVVTSSAIQQLPGVVVRDSNRNPVQGVTVFFIASAGAGSVSPASAVSGSNGIARLTSWTAGSIAGTNTVSAKVGRLPAVVFSATIVEPAPATLAVPTRTARPTELDRTMPSGLTISWFTIANGSPRTADRDVTYQLAYVGSGASYRVGEGARPTGQWLIAPRSTASGIVRLIAGPEGTRTLYLEIRKDASSASSIRTTSIQLKYPLGDLRTDRATDMPDSRARQKRQILWGRTARCFSTDAT